MPQLKDENNGRISNKKRMLLSFAEGDNLRHKAPQAKSGPFARTSPSLPPGYLDKQQQMRYNDHTERFIPPISKI